MHVIQKIIAAACAVTASQLAFADQGTLSVGTGFSSSSGNYGTSATTRVTSIPFLARYEKDLWTFKLTVPYVEVSGTGGVIPGIGQVANTNPRGRGRNGGAGATAASSAAATGTARGLGDVVASATYSIYNDQAAALGVDVTGKVKFATADRDKGLGTGENDYSAQVDVYKGYGPLTVFAGVGYNVLGSSEFIRLDNVFNATVGGIYRVDDRLSAGVSYDARQRVAASASPVSELTEFVTYKIDRSWKAQAYLTQGLANGSPRSGVGATVNYAF